MPNAQCPIPHNIATEILSIYDSPLYVYQGDILRQTIARITKSIAYPHTKFHFASVTNGNISLLQIFKNCGWGIHANTPGDVYLALKAGFSPENIVYSGSNLSAEEMTQLLNWGISAFNLDSINQLQLFCDAYKSQNNNNNICSASILLAGGKDINLLAGGKDINLLAGGKDINLLAGGKDINLLAGGKDINLLAGGKDINLLAGGKDINLLAGGKDINLLAGGKDINLLAGGKDINLPAGGKDINLPANVSPREQDFVNTSEQDARTTNNKIKPATKEIKLGLRLNLPEITGESRIGVRPNDFIKAVEVAKKANLKVRGLHFYRGTGTNATKAFTEVINLIIETAKLLPDWQYLDFGGGFGYPYHHDGVAFNWESFGREITDMLLKLDRKIDLIIEPGRAAIAGCATLLARVVSVKWQQDKQIIGVDTTVANLSVPSVHGGYREIISWKSGKSYTTDVCGNTTYSRDYLGKNSQLPKLEIGDIIAILDVGAYGYAMSSHFLHRPRPAEVLLDNNNHNHKLIRRREDYDILLHNQIFS